VSGHFAASAEEHSRHHQHTVTGTGELSGQVEAYRGHIIMPNRLEEAHGNMYEGHFLASETYVGGHVEALEAGVFRSDIPTHFKIDPSAAQQVKSDSSYALLTVPYMCSLAHRRARRVGHLLHH
jgi:hypothetical protein